MNYEEKYKEALERAKLSRLQLLNIGEEATEIEYIFPELRESEDEKTRKEIIDFLQETIDNVGESPNIWTMNNAKKWIAWLEKQGKQEHIDESKPKFKVGDWVVKQYVSSPYVIVDIKNNLYILNDIEGNKYEETIDFVHNRFHLWTIEDANDGDVLTAHESLVLFKEIDGLNIRCYCTYHFMNNTSFYVDTLQNKDAFYPATKEQCDTLERAMTNAGYRWNKEELKLEKI